MVCRYLVMPGVSQAEPGSCRIVELLTQQPEEHGILPLAVPPVRLALDTLAHVAGALRLRDCALVEAVDLEPDTMQIEVDEEMPLEDADRRVADAPAAEARLDGEPSRLGDPVGLVHDME